MCTVTFIPTRNTIFITSNRDEKLVRQKAIPPAVYRQGNQNFIFPKDAMAGGTWIAVKENGDAAVLLNGAFIPHPAQPSYRKSRGLIFLDILQQKHPSCHLLNIDLHSIEPFTIVLLENNLLYEFRWDGHDRYYKQLPAYHPHIWSSVTLYDGSGIKKRAQWFASFLNDHPGPTQQDIIDFHRFAGDGDKTNDLLMNRQGVYSTVSITSLQLTSGRGSMKYLDTTDDSIIEKEIDFTPEAILT